MGSIRRKLHNDCVIMTEVKMKTKLPLKKSREDETMTLSIASSSATALRIASSYFEAYESSSRRTAVKNFVMG